MTLTEIFPLWKTHKRNFVKRSSMSCYILLIDNHIIPYFGTDEAIEEVKVQAFVLEKINSGLSQKTTKDILIVLKMLLKFGQKYKYIEYTPWDIDFPVQDAKGGLEVISLDDHKKIISYVKQNLTFRNLGVLLTISTGMRIGEVCALTWSDIDLENGVVKVSKTIQRIYFADGVKKKTELIIDTPKTKGSFREVPLTKDVLDIIKALKKVVNDDFFILTNEIKPTEPRVYRLYFHKFMAGLGIPPIKFHGLRHTFATRCVNAKVDIKTVSVMLGHSNITTTLNLYVHPNLESKKTAIVAFSKFLK